MIDKVSSKSLEILPSGTKKGKKEKRCNDASLKKLRIKCCINIRRKQINFIYKLKQNEIKNPL